jgi:RNA polymerase sigma factor (TIGR02999 family)
MPTISSLFASAAGGDGSAADALFAALYAELHRMARRQVARNASDLTLGTTSLLHEAYLDIAGREGAGFPDRGRFMAYAARVMRNLIIDHARRRKALKRGGGVDPVTADAELALAQPAGDEGLARLGEALERLGGTEPLLAQVVDLKFFCGFTLEEIAVMQGLSTRTVQRRWDKARIYLHGVLEDAVAPL